MSDNPNLPRFRKDLKIYTGPLEADGSPTYNIYDSFKGQFYKISWKESLIFKIYTEEMSASQLAQKISSSFPVEITEQDVNLFFSQAALLGLLIIPQEGQKFYDQQVKSKGSSISWLLRNYLFLRIPLFHPDVFLSNTLHYVKFLGSKTALILYGILIFIGFAALLNQLDSFFNTFSYYFSLEGIIIYACVLTAIKSIHELSHAYTAKNFGLYVPTMGIALILLWPVLYTDVTEGWKLQNRRKRFFISFAGVAAEFVMAGLATLGWIFSTPGIFQSLCFLIASTSWFMTILINVNPAVRFDGYYILSDLWGVDNLMSRAFAYTRWQFHKTFLGMEVDCPEWNISRSRGTGFVIYSIYTIIYRLFLYTAIALFVYFNFTKIVGIILFLAEIWIFFVTPVVWEIQALYHLRDKLTLNFRSILTSTLVLTAAVWFFFPFEHTISLPGVIIPQEKKLIYAPVSGKIVKITTQNGQIVDSGTPLIQIHSEYLDLKLAETKKNEEILTNELLAFARLHGSQMKIAAKQAEIDQNEQVKLGLLKLKDELNIRSTEKGIIVHWNTLLKPEEYVYEGQIFGSIADLNHLEVIAFANEIEVSSLSPGQKATVFFQSSALETIAASIKNIDKKRTSELIYPSLASIYGGPLAVEPQRRGPNSGALLLHDSYYKVTLELAENSADIKLGQSVEVETKGPRRSYFVELLKTVYRAVFKESSF